MVYTCYILLNIHVVVCMRLSIISKCKYSKHTIPILRSFIKPNQWYSTCNSALLNQLKIQLTILPFYLQYVQLTRSLISEELSLLDLFPILFLHYKYPHFQTEEKYFSVSKQKHAFLHFHVLCRSYDKSRDDLPVAAAKRTCAFPPNVKIYFCWWLCWFTFINSRSDARNSSEFEETQFRVLSFEASLRNRISVYLPPVNPFLITVSVLAEKNVIFLKLPIID